MAMSKYDYTSSFWDTETQGPLLVLQHLKQGTYMNSSIIRYLQELNKLDKDYYKRKSALTNKYNDILLSSTLGSHGGGGGGGGMESQIISKFINDIQKHSIQKNGKKILKWDNCHLPDFIERQSELNIQLQTIENKIKKIIKQKHSIHEEIQILEKKQNKININLRECKLNLYNNIGIKESESMLKNKTMWELQYENINKKLDILKQDYLKMGNHWEMEWLKESGNLQKWECDRLTEDIKMFDLYCSLNIDTLTMEQVELMDYQNNNLLNYNPLNDINKFCEKYGTGYTIKKKTKNNTDNDIKRKNVLIRDLPLPPINKSKSKSKSNSNSNSKSNHQDNMRNFSNDLNNYTTSTRHSSVLSTGSISSSSSSDVNKTYYPQEKTIDNIKNINSNNRHNNTYSDITIGSIEDKNHSNIYDNLDFNSHHNSLVEITQQDFDLSEITEEGVVEDETVEEKEEEVDVEEDEDVEVHPFHEEENRMVKSVTLDIIKSAKSSGGGWNKQKPPLPQRNVSEISNDSSTTTTISNKTIEKENVSEEEEEKEEEVEKQKERQIRYEVPSHVESTVQRNNTSTNTNTSPSTTHTGTIDPLRAAVERMRRERELRAIRKNQQEGQMNEVSSFTGAKLKPFPNRS